MVTQFLSRIRSTNVWCLSGLTNIRPIERLICKVDFERTYCYVFTLKNNKKNCNQICVLVSLKNSLLSALLLSHYSYLTDTSVFTAITACPIQLFRYSAHNRNCFFSSIRNLSQDCLNYNWLLPTLPGPFRYTHLQSAERSQIERFMISLSR